MDLKNPHTLKYVQRFTRTLGSRAIPFQGVFQQAVTDTRSARYVRANKTASGEGFFITALQVRGR